MRSYQQEKALSEALKANLEWIEAQIEEIQYNAEGFSLKKQEENTQPVLPRKTTPIFYSKKTRGNTNY